jgi:hypothetical protein
MEPGKKVVTQKVVVRVAEISDLGSSQSDCDIVQLFVSLFWGSALGSTLIKAIPKIALKGRKPRKRRARRKAPLSNPANDFFLRSRFPTALPALAGDRSRKLFGDPRP